MSYNNDRRKNLGVAGGFAFCPILFYIISIVSGLGLDILWFFVKVYQFSVDFLAFPRMENSQSLQNLLAVFSI